jgi:hypothetical protein
VVTAGFAINAGFDIKLVIEKIETTLEHCAHVRGMEATEAEEYLCTGFNNALRLAQDTPDASSGNGATEQASKCVREITEAASTRCAETQSAIRQWAEIGAEACTRLAQMMAPDRPDETHWQPEPECDHAPARGTLVALLKRGLGLCVEHVCNLDPSVVNAIEQVVKAAADQDKTALATHDVSTIPFGVSAAAVLANLLQLTEVQSVGAVPMRALQSNSISEVNITGQGQVGACEASLLGYYFDCNSKFDRIVLNEKYTLATANCNESVWDCKAKGLGPAQVMVLVATLSTNSAAVVERVDVSENPFGGPMVTIDPVATSNSEAREGVYATVGDGRFGQIKADPDSDQEVKLIWLDDGSESGYTKVDKLTVIVDGTSASVTEDFTHIEALGGIKAKSLAIRDCKLGPKAIVALSSALSIAVVEAVDVSDNRFDPALISAVKDRMEVTIHNCCP